jgi:hypothetical protein
LRRYHKSHSFSLPHYKGLKETYEKTLTNKDSDLRSYGLRLEAEDESYLVFAPVEEYRNHQVMPQRIFVEKVHEC